ncbi:MAG: AAA family ATPase [Planctomycetota bacterium]
MLTHVEIHNFRCLKEVSVPLKPLTVLVGANDTGKSAFLTALQWLTGFYQIRGRDFWRKICPDRISVTGRIGRKEKIEAFLFFPNPIPVNEDQPYNSVREASTFKNLEAPCALFQLPSQGSPMVSKGQSDTSGPPALQGDGGGVPTLLDFLLRREPKSYFEYIDALKLLVPGLDRIEIATPAADLRRIDLRLEQGFVLNSESASVGVKSIIFFLALSFHPAPPKLVLIEEPENGVHPKRLKQIVELLRDLTKGRFGRQPIQIILSTHSPFLLDCIDLKTDQVLVFKRNDDGSRTAEPADAERLKNFLDEFMLGEVWYNEGEEGLVARKA